MAIKTSYSLHIHNLFILDTSCMCHINAYKAHISTPWHCRCSKYVANMVPYATHIIIREHMQQMSCVISFIFKAHLGFLTDDHDVHIVHQICLIYTLMYIQTNTYFCSAKSLPSVHGQQRIVKPFTAMRCDGDC